MAGRDTVPEPTATGDLAERPLPHLLAYAHAQRMTGTFELADDPRQYALLSVAEGNPSRVWTSEPVAYLGRVLYESGALTDAQLGASLAEIAATKALHGQALLAKGLIDEAALAHALRQQRLHKLLHVFSFPPASRFSFYADVDLVEARPGDVEPAPALPVIWRGITTQASAEHVRAALAAVGPRALRLAPGFDTQGFRDYERAVLESLRQWPGTAATLARQPGMDGRLAELLVYFLVITRQCTLVDAPAASTAPPPMSARSPAPPSVRVPPMPAPTPPPGSVRAPFVSSPTPPPGSVRVPPVSVRTPGPAGARVAVPPQSVRSPAVPGSHASLPRVPPSRPGGDAPPSSIRGVPLSGPQSVRGGPESARMPPPSVRMPPASVRGAAPAPPPPEPVKQSPEAEQAFGQAEMNFVLGEHKDALRFLRDALQISPKMPAALVLMAAIEAASVRDGQEDRLREIVKRLDSIVARHPTARRARFYRAQIRRKLGDKLGAIEDLQAAVASDPDDAEARRELRMAEQTDPAGSKPMSFFDRLRGR